MSYVKQGFDWVDEQLEKGLDQVGLGRVEDEPETNNNRVTIFVPAHETRFNLGIRFTDAEETSDPGVTAETREHQHFFTIGSTEEDVVTLLRLGTPAKSVPAEDASTDELIVEKVRRIPDAVDYVKENFGKPPKELLRERIQATRDEIARLRDMLAKEEEELKRAKDNRAERYTILETMKKVRRLKAQLRAVMNAPIQPLLDAQEELRKHLRPVTTHLEYPAPGTRAIGSINPDAANHWAGFTMITQGAAYQEAQHNFVIASASGEVRIAAEQAITLGSPGDVIIGADVLSTVSDYAENYDDTKLYDEPGLASTYFSRELLTGVTGVATSLTAAALAIGSFVTLKIKPTPGKAGWATGSSLGRVAGYIALGKTMHKVSKAVSAFQKLGMGNRDRTQGWGNVGIFGTMAVNIVSRNAATMYSHVSTVVSAGLFAKMASIMTTVSGVYSASVQGMYEAGISSLMGTKVSSHFGDAVVQGHGGVVLSSPSGHVTATSKDHVQLNSTDGKAFVHGTKGFYIGGGGGIAPPSLEGTDLLAGITSPVSTLLSPAPPRNCPPGDGFAIKGDSAALTMGPVMGANRFYTKPGKVDSLKALAAAKLGLPPPPPPEIAPGDLPEAKFDTINHVFQMRKGSSVSIVKDSALKLFEMSAMLQGPSVHVKAVKGGNVNVQGVDVVVKGRVLLG
jgi:hypothetical protein